MSSYAVNSNVGQISSAITRSYDERDCVQRAQESFNGTRIVSQRFKYLNLSRTLLTWY